MVAGRSTDEQASGNTQSGRLGFQAHLALLTTLAEDTVQIRLIRDTPRRHRILIGYIEASSLAKTAASKLPLCKGHFITPLSDHSVRVSSCGHCLTFAPFIVCVRAQPTAQRSCRSTYCRESLSSLPFPDPSRYLFLLEFVFIIVTHRSTLVWSGIFSSSACPFTFEVVGTSVSFIFNINININRWRLKMAGVALPFPKIPRDKKYSSDSAIGLCHFICYDLFDCDRPSKDNFRCHRLGP